MIKDLIACLQLAMREWKRRAWIRKRSASVDSPF